MPSTITEENDTPEETVAKIRTTSANPVQIRAATVNLADVLHAAPADPSFDLEIWKRQWSDVDAELNSITRANDVAEGRRRL